MLAGFSRVDVTPPLGTLMSGYNRPRYAEGILDPIEINAVAFNDGENTSLIIVADFLGITQERVQQIRSMIEQELSVPSNNTFIAATHTHTSIKFGVADFAPSIGNRLTVIDDPNTIYVILRKFVDVARMAIDDMKEATLSVGSAQTSRQISFVRRFLMKDGRVQSFPRENEFCDVVRSLGEPDNTLRLVKISREDADDIVIANFSTHPDTTTGSKFSADWPAHSRRNFERETPGVKCLMLVGAQGDTNHIDVSRVERQFGPEVSQSIGRVIADAIHEAFNNTTPVATDKIQADHRVVYNKTRTDGMEKYEESKQLIIDHAERRKRVHAQELAAARRIVNIRDMPIYRPVPVSAMSLGDVAVVGFGGEAFTDYAAHARDAAPNKFVIAITCCNGYQGYLPTKSAYEDGGYESGSAAYSSTLEEEIRVEVVDMLNKFYK